MNESALTFDCCGSQLVGLVHRPDDAARRGIVIVVGGGPQYRVGGHRQLVIWARRLAAAGYPVFRFDYRGMGDSYGDFLGFEDIQRDIRAAVDCFIAEVPGVEEVVLWGECDAVPAILEYGASDPRVRGAVLLNPWARSEIGQAKAVLRHYYIRRVLEPSFWRKIVTMRFNVFQSLASFANLVRKAASTTRSSIPAGSAAAQPDSDAVAALPARLIAGFAGFRGPLLLVISGRDLIAREFDETVGRMPQWQDLLRKGSITRHDLRFADHTFSSEVWRDQVAAWGLAWLAAW